MGSPGGEHVMYHRGTAGRYLHHLGDRKLMGMMEDL